MSKELYEQIEDVLKTDLSDRHSLFQLRYFVVGKEPTNQARLWRCLRELHSRQESLKSLRRERENVEDEIALVDLDIFPLEQAGSARTPRENIHMRQLNRRREALVDTQKSLENKVRWTEEEAEFFVKAYRSLEKNEKLKPFDDMESQVRYWNEKLHHELNTKVVLNQPLDAELVKTILALPEDVPARKSLIRLLDPASEQRQIVKETDGI